MVFAARDVPALASTLRRVLDDPQLCVRLRRNAARRVREVCDPETVVARRIEHYRRAVEAVGRGGAG
jgi:hypothetical protein